MKKTKDMKKYYREYKRKYRLRPDVIEKRKEYENRPEVIARRKNHKPSEKSMQREECKRQRDMYMMRLKLVTRKLIRERRIITHRKSTLRLKTIETLVQKQKDIINKIDEYCEEIEMTSYHDKKNN